LSIVIAFEWLLVAFIAWKSDAAFVHYFLRVARNPRSLPVDILVALLLSVLSFLVPLVIVRVLGSADWPSLEGMRQHSILEIAEWIAASLTAGICEEIIFRGYLLQQVSAWTGSATIGVCCQAAVFGIWHGYQGWKNIVLIVALASLYGAFAVWRKGLRANMIAHAVVDILSAF
jgi:membrane protease YdiL (CAAX protease family)